MGESGRRRVVSAAAEIDELDDSVLATADEQVVLDRVEVDFVDGSLVELERVVERELGLADDQLVQFSVCSARNSHAFCKKLRQLSFAGEERKLSRFQLPLRLDQQTSIIHTVLLVNW